MKAVPVFYATVRHGEDSQGGWWGLQYDAPNQLRRWIESFKPGAEVEVVIRKRRKGRSLAQNRYHWGYLINEISHFLKDDPESVHYALLAEYWRQQDPKSVLPGGKTSSTMTTVEMNEFHEWIRRFAVQFLEMPPLLEPNEVEL